MFRTLQCLAAAAVATAAAGEAGGLAPPRANTPMVQDGLIGTWRLFDPETQTYEPTGTGVIEISADSFSMFGVRMLPNSDVDTWFYMCDGLVGENTDMYYLPFCFFTYLESQDYLLLADTPAPALDTPGVAVFKRYVP